MGQIVTSVSFDAKDFKIAAHLPNIVVISNFRNNFVPRQFSSPTCRFFQNLKISSLALEFYKSRFCMKISILSSNHEHE